MDIQLHIPEWLLWVLATPVALVVALALAIGLWFLVNLRNFRFWM